MTRLSWVDLLFHVALDGVSHSAKLSNKWSEPEVPWIHSHIWKLSTLPYGLFLWLDWISSWNSDLRVVGFLIGQLTLWGGGGDSEAFRLLKAWGQKPTKFHLFHPMVQYRSQFQIQEGGNSLCLLIRMVQWVYRKRKDVWQPLLFTAHTHTTFWKAGRRGSCERRSLWFYLLCFIS